MRPVSDKKLTSVSNEAATVISPLQPTRLRGITAVGVSNTAAIASQPIANTLEKPTQSIPKQGESVEMSQVFFMLHLPLYVYKSSF